MIDATARHFIRKWGMATGLLGCAFSMLIGALVQLDPVLLFVQMVAAFVFFLLFGLFLARFVFSHRLRELAPEVKDYEPYIDFVLGEERPSGD